MFATTYEIRKIGHGLKHNTGQYKITGLIVLGAYDCWVISDFYSDYSVCVLVLDRPTWKKYVEK